MTCLRKFLWLSFPTSHFSVGQASWEHILSFLDFGVTEWIQILSPFFLVYLHLCISILLNLIILLQEEAATYISALRWNRIVWKLSLFEVCFIFWSSKGVFEAVKCSLFQKRCVGGRKRDSVWLVSGCWESPKFQTHSWASHGMDGFQTALPALFLSLSGTTSLLLCFTLGIVSIHLIFFEHRLTLQVATTGIWYLLYSFDSQCRSIGSLHRHHSGSLKEKIYRPQT